MASMQRGKRKSPFIGKTEPLSSAAQPILYSRYNDLSDILLVPQATATQAQQPDVVKASPASAAQAAKAAAPSTQQAGGSGRDVAADVAAGKKLKQQKKGTGQAPAEAAAQEPFVGQQQLLPQHTSVVEAAPLDPALVANTVAAAVAAEKAAFAAKKLAKRQKVKPGKEHPQQGQQMVEREPKQSGSLAAPASPSAKAAFTAAAVQATAPDITAIPAAVPDAAVPDGACLAASVDGTEQQPKHARREAKKKKQLATATAGTAQQAAGVQADLAHKGASQGAAHAAASSQDAPAQQAQQAQQSASQPAQPAQSQPLTREEEEIAKRKRIKRAKRAARRQNPPAADMPAAGNLSNPGQSALQPTAANSEADQAAPTAGAQAGSELSKKKQKQQKGVVAATKVVSGPSNAEEAKVIRQALGIDPAKPDSTKAPQTFAFGFSLASTSGVDEAAATAADEENRAAGTAEEGGEAAEAGQPASASAAPAGPDGQATTIDLDSADPATRARLQRIMGVEAPAGLERRVFVGGMPFSYEEEDIREYWSYCGEIEDLDIMRFPDTGRFKGIAFITFATVEGYQAALECDGEMLDSTRLKVEKCISAGRKEGRAARKQAEKERPVHAMPAPKTPGYHVAYVGNIAFEAIAKDLEAVFEDCKVTLVRLHTDRDTGKSKGYAHVHFADEESLDRAIEFSGAELMGRAIKIGYAQPKRP